MELLLTNQMFQNLNEEEISSITAGGELEAAVLGTIGAVGGACTGFLAGAVAGSSVPIIGTTAGAVIGAVGGGCTGLVTGIGIGYGI